MQNGGPFASLAQRLIEKSGLWGDAFEPVFGAPRQIVKVNNAITTEIRVQTVARVQPAQGKQ